MPKTNVTVSIVVQGRSGDYVLPAPIDVWIEALYQVLTDEQKSRVQGYIQDRTA